MSIRLAILVLFLLATAIPAAMDVQPDPTLHPHHFIEDRMIGADVEVPPTIQILLREEGERDLFNWRINSDNTNQVQNEQQVGINPTDPDNVVAVWRDFRLGHREVGVGYSFDGGMTWTDALLDGPAQYPLHSDPGLTWDRHGNFYAVILSYYDTNSSNGLFVLKSTDGGVNWGAPVTVIDGVPGVFEDKELIACDRSGGLHDGNLYVTWARFYTTRVFCCRSTNGGASFQPEVQVSDGSGLQWPVPVVGSDGTLYIAWVESYPNRIKIDRSFDGGASFGSDITVTDVYAQSDYLNGGIVSYSYPAMDIDVSGGEFHGRLYIAYMDRVYGDYDMFLRYSDDQGVTWSPRLRINDDAQGNGKDQFHPWLAVGSDGSVNVIFYDRRNSPSNYHMDLYLALSLDGGQSIESQVRVTTESSDPNAGMRAGLIGEYIGLAVTDRTRIIPVWTDTREGSQDTYTTQTGWAPVGVADWEPNAGSLKALPAAPNPFRRETRVAFQSARGERIKGEVYDVAGRLVRRMDVRVGVDGNGTLVWDGSDEAGRAAGNGLYLIRLDDGRDYSVVKTLLLR